MGRWARVRLRISANNANCFYKNLPGIKYRAQSISYSIYVVFMPQEFRRKPRRGRVGGGDKSAKALSRTPFEPVPLGLYFELTLKHL